MSEDSWNTPEMVAWKNNPQTQRFLEHMRQFVRGEQDNWLEGAFLSSDFDLETRKNILSLGAARAIQVMILDIEGIKMPEKEGNYEK